MLQAQTPQRVGLLRHDAIAPGADAARERLNALRAEGVRIAIADAVSNGDLLTLAEACADLPLLTAGSGVALGLPPAYARRGWLQPDAAAAALPAVRGASAIVSGSCSEATNAQVARWLEAGGAGVQVDPLALHQGSDTAQALLSKAQQALSDGPVLVYATATPERVGAVQQSLGVQAAGELVERALAQVARGLVDAGVRRLVVAGGETSGAVVQALGVRQLRIGPSICPGVPWTGTRTARGDADLLLALKSGNFGGPDFFREALAMTEASA